LTPMHKRRKKVLDRMSRIEGHVRGIKKMVEEDRGCPELLIQIAAVRAALDRVGQIVLEDHMEACLVEAVRAGEADTYLSEIKEALSKFF